VTSTACVLGKGKG